MQPGRVSAHLLPIWISFFSPHHHVIINAQCGSVVILEMALYRGHLALNEPAQQKRLHSEADAHEERRFSHTSPVSFFSKSP